MKNDLRDNRGFTLLELLLSIVLLGILILPALYGFFSAAKINKKANDTQVATDLAQNVMESFKDLSIEDTAIQFYGKDSLNILRNNYVFDSYADGGYGEYMEEGTGRLKRVTTADSLSSVKITSDGSSYLYHFNAPADRKKFYFGLKNVKKGEVGYDALVTMDASSYSDAKYVNTMNNYQMPKLTDLDQDAVSVIDLEGLSTTWSDDTADAHIINKTSTDEQAINDFTNINLAYLANLKSQPVPEGTTPVYPDPIPQDTIKSNIRKKIIINLAKDTVHKKVLVKCSLSYSCDLDLNGDLSGEVLAPMEIVSGTFPIPEEEAVESFVYLFYTPSDFTFNDTITIENNGSIANVYIVSQSTPKWRIAINESDTPGSTTKVFTNLTDAQRISSSVIENNIYEFEEAKKRIFNISVSVYQTGAIDSGYPDHALVTLTSTGEE